MLDTIYGVEAASVSYQGAQRWNVGDRMAALHYGTRILLSPVSTVAYKGERQRQSIYSSSVTSHAVYDSTPAAPTSFSSFSSQL